MKLPKKPPSENNLNITRKRDHGGGLDAAVARFGGNRSDWLDLSTGINPEPYPVPMLPAQAWTALPDVAAASALTDAARSFWQVPQGCAVLAVPGASAAIAHIPLLAKPGRVAIPGPTYNEHAASFAAAGWDVMEGTGTVAASVHVHPNNPDGKRIGTTDLRGTLRVIDESFCDVMPEETLIGQAAQNGTLVLKSFGKFWGLAGLRLGFVIGPQMMIDRLSDMLGPWPVSGPALHIGAAALHDQIWADATRRRLAQDTNQLDRMMANAGAQLVGGTTLFRLYDVGDAAEWQTQLAQHRIWSRVFPYNSRWLRLGLPAAAGWDRLLAALA
jgi:cobalamin biosynthetic protein CobC